MAAIAAEATTREEAVADMVSYRKNVTGLDNTIFISVKFAQHAPRIKVAVDPPTHIDPFGSSASVHPRWAAWRKGPAEEAARPPVGRNAQRIHGEPINRLPVAMAEGFAEPGLCRSPPTNSERFGYLPTRGTAALLRICWRTASGARC